MNKNEYERLAKAFKECDENLNADARSAFEDLRNEVLELVLVMFPDMDPYDFFEGDAYKE